MLIDIIFQLMFKFNFAWRAKESFFIDDKLENVEAAKKLEIDAFQFDYKNIEALKDYINL